MRFPKPPTEAEIKAAVTSGNWNSVMRWFSDITKIIGGLPGIAWAMVDKTGSRLDDIETRAHNLLQSISGWSSGADVVQDKHISQANGKKWEDHVDVIDGNPHGTDHAALEGIALLDPTDIDVTIDKHLSNAQAKVWQDHIANTGNPHSTTGDQVLPDQTGNSGKALTTDGTNCSWGTPWIGAAATSATSGAMTVNITTTVITITPTGNCTFNGSGGIAGQSAAFIITTSGTTSYTLTWNTNFKVSGTLATGAVTAKVFVVHFVCKDGTLWVETSRTAAM